MKKVLLFIAAIVLAGPVMFGQVRNCGTQEHEAVLKAKYPGYEEQRAAIEDFTNKFVARQHSEGKSMGGVTVTIPIVFHVVYKTAAQNIPDDRLLEQISILNEDFRRLNADTSDTPFDFKDEAADCGIEFCLAQVDPAGNPTAGILRVSTTVNSFGTDDAVKFTADGGDDAWPADSYLNFWVCNLGASLLGYAQFPGGPAATDGVVIHYNHVGLNDAGYPYHLGRTATHEIGHWLNLFHIWGDDTGCGGTDAVADTPNQKTENYGCPGFPHTDMCSPDAPGVMFMNYMDYTDDGCMNMFTEGQKSRMMALFEPGGARYNIINSDGCGLQPYDAQALASLPGGSVCELSVSPVVTIKNHGTEVLTSVDIVYSVDGGAPSTYHWTGSLASTATEDVSLPAITTTEGAHTLSATLENPNGFADGDMGDNTTETDFTVALTGSPLPVTQGFETAGFPYAGYTLNNPDDYYTWERTNDAASIGTYSIYMDHFDNDANGEIDEFVLPGYDLTGMTSIAFTFDVAYALYTASGIYSDTLQVLASNDCGATWTSVYKKANPDLQTAPVTMSSFVPDATEWRTESIDLSGYLGSSQLFIKFRTISDYENNLYVDDINLNDGQTNGIAPAASSLPVSVFPNPAGNMINIRFNSTITGTSVISIYNVLGETVYSETVGQSNGINNIALPLGDLQAGYYRITISNNSQTGTAAFVKE